MILVILYIDNRYSSQQEMIEIDRLKKELIDTKYDALTISSELTEKSRQSRIEEYISAEGTPLETASTPPYLIKTRIKMVPGQKYHITIYAHYVHHGIAGYCNYCKSSNYHVC